MNFVLRIASNFNFILFSFQYLLHCERRNKNYQDYSANVFVFWTRVEKPCFIVEFVFRSLSFSSLFNLATSEWTLHVEQSSHLTVRNIVLCRFFLLCIFMREEKNTRIYICDFDVFFLRCWCFARFKWRF